jgi:hypothetical protein
VAVRRIVVCLGSRKVASDGVSVAHHPIVVGVRTRPAETPANGKAPRASVVP